MELVPFFEPIRRHSWTLWKVLGVTLGRDIASHALRLLIDGFWHDLVTDALATTAPAGSEMVPVIVPRSD